MSSVLTKLQGEKINKTQWAQEFMLEWKEMNSRAKSTHCLRESEG